MNNNSPATAASPSKTKANRQERRRERRALCDGFAEVTVFEPEILFRGRILNLSMHGCFVETRAYLHLPCAADASIRFNLRSRNYRVQAITRSIQPDLGVGFEFRFGSSAVEASIRRLVEELELPQTTLIPK